MFFVFRGSLDNSKSIGTNNLIKEFAKIVTSPEDIILNYPFLKKKKMLKKEFEIDDDVEDEYKKIYSFINSKPIDVNEIIRKSNSDSKEVMSKLTILELKGKIKRTIGNSYVRSKT